MAQHTRQDRHHPRQPLDVETAKRDQTLVDDAGMATFPASDPPGWTTTHAGRPCHAHVMVDTPREVRERLRGDVERLVASSRQTRLEHATSVLLDTGRHVTRIPLAHRTEVEILEVAIRGAEDGEELVIGADYDTNPSATAVLLGLARVLAGRRFARTIRLVAFAEGARGSHDYAKRIRDNAISLRGMLSLESVGFLLDRQDHATFASLLVPSWRGMFVAFVGDRASAHFLEEARVAFALGTPLEARAVSLPSMLPLVASSGHRSFAHAGFPAALLTDTGPLRNTHPPSAEQLSLMLNYDAMADVVFGLASVAARLAGGAAERAA